jgi:subtilisin family serine protease
MRIGSGTVRENLITASQERRFAGGQPIYLFTMAQVAAANSDQYAPAKLNVEGAHKLATGNGVKVALIDSAVDGRHPDLAGAIAQNFNAVNDDAKPQPHGTAMAGAIAARRTMLSIAPSVQLLAVEAFSPNDNSGEGTTINILKGLDWAAAQGARVVNMSFAGPSDPRLRDALKAAANRGMVLIAASGNAGANSPPLYPAADPNVIAVTATDAKDGLFAQAVRGNHVAVAAPGIDILVPAPDGAYQLTTGTSVAAAEVSGVAALLIERNPKLSGKEVRDILMRTARDLGPKGRDRLFGAGLVDAFQAVTAASPAGH